MNFDFEEITWAVARIIIILIGIAVVIGAFGVAGIVVRYLIGVWQ